MKCKAIGKERQNFDKLSWPFRQFERHGTVLGVICSLYGETALIYQCILYSFRMHMM